MAANTGKTGLAKLSFVLLILLLKPCDVAGFLNRLHDQAPSPILCAFTDRAEDTISGGGANLRRDFLNCALISSVTVVSPFIANAEGANKAQVLPLEEYLYKILRVREATNQEARLITSGKFKDVQRANVKLAVRFMLQNYRLGDSFVQSSAYLEGSERRLQAGQVGQSVIQSLQTILEYFDSSDVQNLKVGTGDNMAGKEALVLRGLESARKGIDDFLVFFPASSVGGVRSRIDKENELNVKEFDASLGSILNLPPPS